MRALAILFMSLYPRSRISYHFSLVQMVRGPAAQAISWVLLIQDLRPHPDLMYSVSLWQYS